MLYLSYTFNSCLVSSIHRTFRKVCVNNAIMNIAYRGFNFIQNYFKIQAPEPDVLPPAKSSDPTQVNIFGSIVRIVPLTGGIQHAFNESDGSPKYRFLRQQGLQPSRHLPDTLIIGVKKSGTRALLEFIRLHPDVRAAGCEVHFFDRHYAKGFHWYRNHMPATIEGQVTMEKTPSYFITKEVPQRVHHMNPGTKYVYILSFAFERKSVILFWNRLLVVVRDPVTRAISDYTQAASKKPGMKKFEELVFLNGSYGSTDLKAVEFALFLIQFLFLKVFRL